MVLSVAISRAHPRVRAPPTLLSGPARSLAMTYVSAHPPPALAPPPWLTRICRGRGGYLRRQGAALPPLASLDLQSPLRFRAMHEEIVTSGEGGRGPGGPAAAGRGPRPRGGAG